MMCLIKINVYRIEKHLQCEKLLGLAGGNTKKQIRQEQNSNLLQRNSYVHFHFREIKLAVFHAIWFSKVNPVTLVVGQETKDIAHSLFPKIEIMAGSKFGI